MPRPVKPDRPVIAEPVVEPIQGTTIVVIHPGSSTLHIGRATDHFPHSIPHVIGRRITNEKYAQTKRNPLSRRGVLCEDCNEKQNYGLKSTKNVIQAMRISGGYRKPKVSSNEISSYNSNVQPVVSEGDQSFAAWTDVSSLPSFIIGEQVLNLQQLAPYNIHWPIRHGQLNTHNGVGGSLSSIAEDLTTLWGKTIETALDIPVKDLNYYRAVLLIPDNFNRSHVKLLVDIILNRLNFSCVIACQESVCGTFGSGLPSACVVDVGAEKTNICCVEDGISLPLTRVTLNYGGNDITRSFFTLLQKSNFPYKTVDLDDAMDRQLLQELKETFCHLSMDIPSGHVHEFQVVRPNEEPVTYKIRLGDEPLLAPAAMFVPDLFGILNEQLIHTFSETQDHDAEDLTDDRYLLEVFEPRVVIRSVKRKSTLSLEKKDIDTKKSKEAADGEVPQPSQELIPLPSPHIVKQHSRIEHLRNEGMPLDEAIMYCIEQCNNQETKRKMYSTVLLIGGGLNFKGADEFLLKRLQAKLPNHYQYLKDQMEVINRPKENDPRTACWKGGAVLSILDSSQELWISRKEWNQYGVRILRERCAFQWSNNMEKQ